MGKGRGSKDGPRVACWQILNGCQWTILLGGKVHTHECLKRVDSCGHRLLEGPVEAFNEVIFLKDQSLMWTKAT